MAMKDAEPSEYNTKRRSQLTLYKKVAQILKEALNNKKGVRTLIYDSTYKNKGLLSALVWNVLKYRKTLCAILEHVSPKFKNEFPGDNHLAEVLIYELLFGKKKLSNETTEEAIVLKYEEAFREKGKKLEKPGKKASVESIVDIETSESGIVIPRYARINTLLTNQESVINSLTVQGFIQIKYDKDISIEKYLDILRNLKTNEYVQDLHFSELLAFAPGKKFYKHPLVEQGHLILQDKSSMISVHELNPEPGSIILDACAAPGIKTSHLAAVIQNKGKIIAVDCNDDRYKNLNKTIRRTGAMCCQTLLQDFLSIDSNAPPYCNVKYILLDPSCSGEGMVRNHHNLIDGGEAPSKERLKTLFGFQIKALKHALRFPNVKRVVYSTCSTTLEENEKVIEDVCLRRKEWFKIRRAFPDWPTRGSDTVEFGDDCVRATPDASLTNGFFVAVIERIKSPNFKGRKSNTPSSRMTKSVQEKKKNNIPSNGKMRVVSKKLVKPEGSKTLTTSVEQKVEGSKARKQQKQIHMECSVGKFVSKKQKKRKVDSGNESNESLDQSLGSSISGSKQKMTKMSSCNIIVMDGDFSVVMEETKPQLSSTKKQVHRKKR